MGALRDCVKPMMCVRHLTSPQELLETFDKEIYTQLKEVNLRALGGLCLSYKLEINWKKINVWTAVLVQCLERYTHFFYVYYSMSDHVTPCCSFNSQRNLSYSTHIIQYYLANIIHFFR